MVPARSLPLEVAAMRSERLETVDSASMLSRREATLRSAATTCLAGIALVQAIELPSLFAQGRQLAVLSMAAMALCLVLGWALAAAPASAAGQLWRGVAATGALVLAGWAVPHAFVVPGLAGRGSFTAMPGLACGLMGAALPVLAAAAARPTRAAWRGFAVALAVAVALAPAAAAALVALGPGTAGGETVLASGGHIHSHGSPENSIVFQPLPGGRGGRYVYRTTAPPRRTSFELALFVGAAFMFTAGAVLYLRGRSAPSEPVALARAEGRLA
jgi:hypothetical protein